MYILQFPLHLHVIAHYSEYSHYYYMDRTFEINISYTQLIHYHINTSTDPLLYALDHDFTKYAIICGHLLLGKVDTATGPKHR
jgi:hypothetical protein